MPEQPESQAMVHRKDTPILRTRGLHKSFARRKVVSDLCIEAFAGEKVGLLGPNGAGKSTSFKMVTGLVRPDAGSMMLNGVEVGHAPLHQRVKMGLGYLPQESTVFRGLSVADNFKVAFEAQRLPSAEIQEKTRALLSKYGLEHVTHSKADSLSGGEKRRLEMARALVAKPKILLLDEPFAGVDPIAVHEIRQFIDALAADAIAVLITDHNVRETLKICDRAYILSQGQVLVSGSPAEIVAHPVARKVYLGEDFTL